MPQKVVIEREAGPLQARVKIYSPRHGVRWVVRAEGMGDIKDLMLAAEGRARRAAKRELKAIKEEARIARHFADSQVASVDWL